MPLADTVRTIGKLATRCSLLFVCSPCLALQWARRRKRHGGRVTVSVELSYPTPLPVDRIDICRNGPILEQPTCRLLQLPPELRHLIFEIALANRLVHIQLVPSAQFDRYILRTTCYPAEWLSAPNDPGIVDPPDDIPVALLLACRAVYVEALPIMHHQNTYYFNLRDLPDILQCSLGQYCLPEIRKLYIHQDFSFRVPTVGLWDSVFETLQHMCLEVLTLEFTVDSAQVHREGFPVDNAWRLGLLAIRHLRTLNIFFQTLGPDSPLDAEKIIDVQAFRDLMIGPEADEKYEAFLLVETKTPEICHVDLGQRSIAQQA
ncbi:hypothetical protein DFH08DRAFT_490302 [Mycena albidolilacea]|uniref:DUF7730 domain-containing protein n=1 Tax=Mycena albidolilacea TaxID=1033008 RepID=A0AAD6Z5V0_9AGAR|nr:hypothetical protein DFH08DRAFT_490302 [Mycena albidolilacea]